MAFIDDIRPLISEGKFEDVESLWMARLESGDLGDIEGYIETAKLLRKADERARGDALLGLLSDTLKERGLWPLRLLVLKEIGRLAKNPGNLRKEIEENVSLSFGHKPSFRRVMETVKFGEPGSNPAEKADRVESILAYDEGEVFFMAGRGVGRVVELNPELGVCRLEFEREKRVSIPLGAAPKNLTPLAPGHLLRAKIDDPEGLRERALGDPQGTFAGLLQSFGRPMTQGEVKDAMIGIVPDAKWTSWWTSARKNPQIVVAGTGARATYSWNASTEAAEQKIRQEFDHAPVKAKLDLARKHSARSRDLANYFSGAIARELSNVVRTDPAMAWEAAAILERLPGDFTLDFDPESLLSGPAASRIVTSVSDRLLREKALRTVREVNPEWPKVYGEVFFVDEDVRILSLVAGELEVAGHSEVRDRLVDETLRYPRRHPIAFYWYCKTAGESETLADRANYALLFQIMDATASDEFAPIKARLRELFDPGGLAVRIVNSADSEENARKLLEILERYGSIEEYRREILRSAAHLKHPHLREAQVEPVYATTESFAAKREELEHLKKVEIPANSKALQAAREMGDLRENFEYKAARQRAEYLSARVGKLQTDLANVRIIDPENIDTSAVRIGTRIGLRNGDIRREVTILGPWESDPERGIYSNQSEAAKALLGKSAGDLVSFMGNDYEIESITRWR